MKFKVFYLAFLTVFANAKPRIPVLSIIWLDNNHNQFSLNSLAPPQASPTLNPVVFKAIPTLKFSSISPANEAVKIPQVLQAPVVSKSPALSQFHTQDDDGAYAYGYFDGPSSKLEKRDPQGRVEGKYNYVDTNGKIQWVYYTADKKGFRVVGTNLPIAPKSNLVMPQSVSDTPEVKEAKIDRENVNKEQNSHKVTKREANPKFYSLINHGPSDSERLPVNIITPIIPDVKNHKTPASTRFLHMAQSPLILQTPIVYQLGAFPATFQGLPNVNTFPSVRQHTIPIEGTTFEGKPYIAVRNTDHNSFLNPGGFLKPINHPNNAVSYSINVPPSLND